MTNIDFTEVRGFQAYYNELKIPKPDINSFITMDIRFTLGIAIDFITYNGLTFSVIPLGYKIRRTIVKPKAADDFLEIKVFEEGEIAILEAYVKAVHACFHIINNPF